MKKLFTLLTLALLSIGSAWADELCSAQIPTGQNNTFSNTEGLAQTGCTLKWSGLQGGTNTVTVGSVDYYKMGSNTAYVQLSLTSGSFIAGDVLTATVTSNGSNKEVDIKVKETATSKVKVSSDETKNIVYTLTADDIEDDGSIKIYRNSNGSNLRVAVFAVSGTRSSAAYTVTFNAGTNGTCGTASLTEESANAGVTLPAVSPNSGYAFNGWFTAASEGTKVGEAGNTYNPTANITLYAQYTAQVAPGISFDDYAPTTTRGKAITLTANLTGAPVPTVTWYQSSTATNSGGTEKGTGATYSPDVATEGTYYYYAVASNGVSPDATSDVITLTVTNPDIDRTGYNTYYVVKDETAVGGEQVICDDITMVYDNVTYNKAVEDNMINSLNANYVASINSGTNAWGVTFTPSSNGILSVGVIINGTKTFSITNATSFDYNGIDQDNAASVGTNSSNTWSPAKKQYTIITLPVTAGTSYKFSVAGSKMSLYGFEFMTKVAITHAYAKTTYVTPAALDFTTVSGLDAYVATSVTATSVKIEKVTEAVPAGTPLLLIGTASTEYTVPVAASATAPATNLLVAGDGTTVFDGLTYDYILYSDGLFYQIGEGTVATTKAYLHLDSAPASRSLNIVFGDEATGINMVQDSRFMVHGSEYFNLNGQRISQPTKGLYILNGKKLMVK